MRKLKRNPRASDNLVLIGVRMLRRERDQLKQLAMENGEQVSPYLRNIIRRRLEDFNEASRA